MIKRRLCIEANSKYFADSLRSCDFQSRLNSPKVILLWHVGQSHPSSINKSLSLYFELASMHNLRFIIRLTEQARQAILDGTFKEFKESFLKSYYGNK